MSEEIITFSGVPCHVFTYEDTNKWGVAYIQREYNFFKSGKSYGILYGAAVDDFDAYLREFESALNTFEVME